MNILLSITFVFGVLHFLTFNKIFDRNLSLIITVISGKEVDRLPKLWVIIQYWFFYFSLCFQSWYWLFNN